ncbi:glycoside hydrolase/deacetylase [Hymenopellis radicata]|nr:glycoside hydrolase/deacetylase [Hymenopellis radicata]
MLRSFFLLLTFTSTVFAHGPVNLGLRTWHQDSDHPVHKLFKRESTDGVDYPDVGSPTWSAAYPASSADPSAMPQEWKDALADAVSAGKIPDIPVTTVINSWTTYPDGSDAGGPVICSSYVQCRGDGDIWDAPDGKIGIAFDDGPAAGTNKLVGFLSEQNETATHFLIGSNILSHSDEFLAIFNQGGDIAVHTWTHPYMTSMTNEQVMVELGWTMEIIHNSTGGRVPKYWRPPYGDCDNRVRAIAQQIFGMEAILWNHDTNDWSIGSDPSTTVDSVDASITGWLTGPKSPGLAILEHELTEDTVQAFMNAFPAMKANGWETASIALLASDTGSPLSECRWHWQRFYRYRSRCFVV